MAAKSNLELQDVPCIKMQNLRADGCCQDQQGEMRQVGHYGGLFPLPSSPGKEPPPLKKQL